MIQDMAASSKGETPDMGDLSDVSAVIWLGSLLFTNSEIVILEINWFFYSFMGDQNVFKLQNIYSTNLYQQTIDSPPDNISTLRCWLKKSKLLFDLNVDTTFLPSPPTVWLRLTVPPLLCWRPGNLKSGLKTMLCCRSL